MRHHRQSTNKHTFLFFTRSFPTEAYEVHLRTLKPQLAFLPPKYAVSFISFWQLDTLLLETLIENGADIHQTFNGSYTPIQQLFTCCNISPHTLKLIKILLRAGADTSNIIHCASVLNTVFTFNTDDSLLFFKAGDGDFSVALHYAVYFRRVDIIPYLLSRGANPRYLSDTCIFWAANLDRIDIITLLLDAGAVVTDRSVYNSNASNETIIFLLDARDRLHPGILYE